MEQKDLYDLTIIGAGVAGMTAAIYALRAGKKVAIIDKEGYGGQIAKSPLVENYPGFTSISGVDLATNIYEQMLNIGPINHIINEVALVKYYRGIFICYFADNTTVCSKSLIVATGCAPKELTLDTKNIYYCATCDGPLFKNKDVIVVGSGNTGATYALDLANYCRRVYICDITFKIMCEPTLAKRIEENEKIQFLPNCTITAVKNNKEGNLEAITLSTAETIKVKAIFGATGQIPQTAFVPDQLISKDSNGFFNSAAGKVEAIPGLFVAGDCRKKQVRQVTTAIGDGAFVAINAIKFLNTKA